MAILKKRKAKKEAKKKQPKKKVVKKIKEALNKAGKKAGLVGKDIAFAQLLPFKKLMKRELDAKGVSHSDHIGDIASKFLKHVVRGKNFEDPHAFSSHGTGSETDFNLVAEAAAGIVTAIFEFLRGLKKKRDAAREGQGEPLTEAEQRILETTEATTDALVEAGEEEAKGEVASQIQEFLFSWKGLATLIIIFALIGFLIARKK